MYGRLFQSTYTGSMFGAGLAAHAVLAYAIAHVVDGRVELNPMLLAASLGSDVKTIEDALEYLGSPDPKSRNKEYEGRRLIREGEFQYWMPSHAKYQAIRDNADRREYFRTKKAEQRARDKAVKNVKVDVKDSPNVKAVSTQADPNPKPQPLKKDPIQSNGGTDGSLADAGSPTLDQVKAAFAGFFDGAARFAEPFFTAMERQRWRDNKGKPITSWQAMGKRYASKAHLNERENPAPSGDNPNGRRDTAAPGRPKVRLSNGFDYDEFHTPTLPDFNGDKAAFEAGLEKWNRFVTCLAL
jgi:hypothetical protein